MALTPNASYKLMIRMLPVSYCFGIRWLRSASGLRTTRAIVAAYIVIHDRPELRRDLVALERDRLLAVHVDRGRRALCARLARVDGS